MQQTQQIFLETFTSSGVLGKILTNDILYSMCDGWPMLVCHL